MAGPALRRMSRYTFLRQEQAMTADAGHPRPRGLGVSKDLRSSAILVLSSALVGNSRLQVRGNSSTNTKKIIEVGEISLELKHTSNMWAPMGEHTNKASKSWHSFLLLRGKKVFV